MGIDPISMAMMGGTLLSAGGSIMEGQAMNKMGKYQQKVAKMNAQIAEENARRAIEVADVEAQESDMSTLAFLGAQEAMQGASGLSMGGGSQVAAREVAKRLGRLDALRIRHAGELEAHAHRTQGVNFLAEGQMARASGRNALTAGFINAGSSLLTGASRVMGRSQFQNSAVPGSFGSLVR